MLPNQANRETSRKREKKIIGHTELITKVDGSKSQFQDEYIFLLCPCATAKQEIQWSFNADYANMNRTDDRLTAKYTTWLMC